MPRWAPDGTRLSYWSTRDILSGWVIGADGSGNRRFTDRGLPMAWSPDGTRLAGMHAYSDTGVGYYEIATGRHVPLTGFGQWPVWMPDSRRILFVTGQHSFYIVDSETGAVRRVYSTRRDVLVPPRFTADGRELFYSRRDTEVDIWLVTIESGSR